MYVCAKIYLSEPSSFSSTAQFTIFKMSLINVFITKFNLKSTHTYFLKKLNILILTLLNQKLIFSANSVFSRDHNNTCFNLKVLKA